MPSPSPLPALTHFKGNLWNSLIKQPPFASLAHHRPLDKLNPSPEGQSLTVLRFSEDRHPMMKPLERPKRLSELQLTPSIHTCSLFLWDQIPFWKSTSEAGFLHRRELSAAGWGPPPLILGPQPREAGDPVQPRMRHHSHGSRRVQSDTRKRNRCPMDGTDVAS